MNWSAVEAVAVSISAVIAASAFVFSVAERWKSRREWEFREWQKVVVHRILHQSAGQGLSFDELKMLYRSEVTAFPDFKLDVKELSEGALRRVLVEMVAARVVEQSPGDRYSLLHPAGGISDVLGKFVNTAVVQSGARELLDHFSSGDTVYETVFENNFKLSLSDVILRVAKEHADPVEKIRATAMRLLSERKLIIRDDGLVGVGTNAVKKETE